ncbi:MAG: hypothetical protein UY27_C0005G0003 [Candidatus Gottesmanbacteria bacterium GW2011_GWA1_48_13]|uniref:DNA polymerase III delta N-terminal domain-containing protein n=1 Tax=Candidatus Gottesmanbacteria bacterium GW2011_GWA1_48_13 TaxID=1618439 RepID=A0A0G1UPL0_9BACT|nr:MAG: hypothetical protein UY27_C0005G0003 [Candidatus Gottesmanbacteria bacterium GW2011_GWA1_48_13]
MLILHGANQVASRSAFLIAKEGKPILQFMGSDLTLDQLVNAVETNSLFGQVNTVVIEGIFSQRPSTNKKAILDYFESHQDADIIIWESKDVTSQVKNFKNVQKFDLPKYIFAFLDNPTVLGLQQVLQTMPPEQILASLATRGYKRVNTKWLASLLDLDFKLKSGILPYDLTTALELWCAKL